MSSKLLILVAVAGACVVRPDGSGPRSECPVSPSMTISTGEIGTRAFRYSGDLGASRTSTRAVVDDIDHRDGTKGQIFIYKTDNPPPSLVLHAERIDSPSKRTFSVRRDFTAAPIPWPGGGTAYTYVHVQREAVLSEPGCWRVGIGDDSAEGGVIMKVK